MPRIHEAQEHSFHHGRSNGRANVADLRSFADQAAESVAPGRAGRGVRRRVLQQPPLRAVALYPGERSVAQQDRSEEHTSDLQSLMRISYAVFCLKKTK